MSRLRSNIVYLGLIQVSNIALPLITVPFLTRTLAPEGYGLMAYVLSIVALLALFTDFGFNLSATKEIAGAHFDTNKINGTVGSVLIVKTQLYLAVSLLTIIVSAIGTGPIHLSIAAVIIVTLLGQTFQLDWLFQGIEKMRSLAICNLVSRLLYVLAILFMVKNPADVNKVLWANAGASCLTAILGFIIMFRVGYKPSFPTAGTVRKTFNNSFGYFVSRLAVGVYTAGCGVFLGHFAGMTQTGLFSLADQIYRTLQSLMSPVSQALYPNTVQSRNFGLVIKTARAMTMLCIVGLFVHLALGDVILAALFGERFAQSKTVISVLLAALIFNTPSVLIGYPLLGALGQARAVNTSVIIGAVLHLCILTALYFYDSLDATHVATSVLFVELLVFGMRLRALKQWRLDSLRSQAV